MEGVLLVGGGGGGREGGRGRERGRGREGGRGKEGEGGREEGRGAKNGVNKDERFYVLAKKDRQDAPNNGTLTYFSDTHARAHTYLESEELLAMPHHCINVLHSQQQCLLQQVKGEIQSQQLRRISPL